MIAVGKPHARTTAERQPRAVDWVRESTAVRPYTRMMAHTE